MSDCDASGVVFVKSIEWSPEVKICLERWGLADLAASKFRIPFVSNADESDTQCVQRLLQSSVVKKWFAERSCQSVPAETEAKLHLLKTSAISMNLFDALKEPGCVLIRSGNIKQCPESMMEGIIVQDVLRKRLIKIERNTNIDGELDLNAGDDDYLDDDDFDSDPTKGLPDVAKRSEFLFHLFSLLAIGGVFCQHDFTLDPYFDTAKAMYRALVTVYRSASTNEVAISTAAFRVYGRPFFLTEHKLQRCYVLFERKANLATILLLNRGNAGNS